MDQGIVTIGIDPGQQGALAALKGQTILEAYTFPKVLGEINYRLLSKKIITSVLTHKPKMIYLEKAQSMPKQGVISMFSYGEHYGVLQGLLHAHELNYTRISPRSWHKALLPYYPHQDDLDPKQNAYNAYLHLLGPHNPEDVLLATKRSHTPHKGIIDACLIALSANILG